MEAASKVKQPQSYKFTPTLQNKQPENYTFEKLSNLQMQKHLECKQLQLILKITPLHMIIFDISIKVQKTMNGLF